VSGVFCREGYAESEEPSPRDATIVCGKRSAIVFGATPAEPPPDGQLRKRNA